MRTDTLALVESALTEEGAPLRVVHQRVDCWSKQYVAEALRELVRQKRAVADGEFKTRVYRRAA